MQKSFDEVVLFARTGLNPRTNFKLGRGTNKYITIKNIHNNQMIIDDNTDVVDDDAISLIHKRSQIKKGDILFCSIGRLGDMFIIDEDPVGWDINESVFAFTLDTDVIRQKYFYYLFKNRDTIEYLSKNSSGSTFKSIKMNQLKKMKFDLPSLEEQDQIVQTLDSVTSIIESRQQELTKLDELIKARFVEMFGDPQINPKGYKKETLNKHADVFVGYPFKSEGYAETGIRIVGGYNLMQGYIVWNECKHWPALRGYEQYLLQNGDIVMAMDRPWVNGGFKIASVDEGHLPALLIQRTACIRVNDVEQEFLYELLNSNRFAEHCNITGSLVPHISNKDINSYEIILPPIAEQKEFSEFVQQVDKSKAVIQKALDETQILFDSLMQEYFG